MFYYSMYSYQVAMDGENQSLFTYVESFPFSGAGRRLAVSRDQAQMQIDAGQERGPTLCLTCGAVYSKGV